MISFQSIGAIMLRYFYIWKSDYNTMFASLYWPLLDIIMWGFVGAWIQQTQHFQNYQFVALLGVLLWQVIGRGSNIIISIFIEELCSNNIINLFSLPLRMIEYILAVILYYVCMILVTTFFCMVFIPALYGISLFAIISNFLIFLLPALISGIAVGFIGLAIIATFGKRGMELGWIFSWFLLPFSGAYYPISVLPWWGQKLAACLPMSYIFEGMRQFLLYQQSPSINILYAVSLGVLYTIGAIFLFLYSFERSRKNGLIKLVE